MSISPPNYTQIPNIIFDYWIPRLKPTEVCVLLILCRKIFGWHKTSDAISANQLSKTTGLSKPTLLSSLKELERLGLVIKIQSSDDRGFRPNQFKLNITVPEDKNYTDPEEIEPDPVKILGGGSKNSDLEVVKNFDGGVVKNLYPQKKDYTKENLTKERERESGGLSPPPPTPPKILTSQKKELGEMKMVKLTAEELKKLNDRFGETKVQNLIRKLDLYLAQKGDKYKSHYATILKWSDDEDQKDGFKLAKHRENSKLAFEKEKDTWKPKMTIVGEDK